MKRNPEALDASKHATQCPKPYDLSVLVALSVSVVTLAGLLEYIAEPLEAGTQPSPVVSNLADEVKPRSDGLILLYVASPLVQSLLQEEPDEMLFHDLFHFLLSAVDTAHYPRVVLFRELSDLFLLALDLSDGLRVEKDSSSLF